LAPLGLVGEIFKYTNKTKKTKKKKQKQCDYKTDEMIVEGVYSASKNS
jgi:hypothetical protein